MECHEPGEVLILPIDGGAENTIGMLSEIAHEKLRIIYSVDDLLKFYGLSKQAERLREIFGSLPFVVRVSEGREYDLARRFSKSQNSIKAAIPNLTIVPQGGSPPELNSQFISEAMQRIGATDSKYCTAGDVSVAILDTGVNPAVLKYPDQLEGTQFETDRKPESPGKGPYDPIGHGSVVAHIINLVAPKTKIISIKIMEGRGNIGSLLSGIMLAEARYSPSIYNLSLSLACDPEFCHVCGHAKTAEFSIEQIRLIFDLIRLRKPRPPLVIAAAGNNSERVSMPAAFAGVLAVGSYDLYENQCSSFASYNAVPADRFILAPGGNQTPTECLGVKPPNDWEREPLLFGTSFSTAFVSGVAARFGCPVCCASKEEADVGDLSHVLECLRQSSDRAWPNYDPIRHGLGLVCC